MNDATPVDPGAAFAALERMLAKEDRISDLIGFLAALDPRPLSTVLRVTAGNPRISREEVLRVAPGGGRRSGRADLLVRDGAGIVALLEIKAAAGAHGDQFDRYDAWAKAQRPPVTCHLISLEADTRAAPDGWSTMLTLPMLLRAWQGGEHPHAGWLACAAAEVLESWIAQCDGKLGRATSPAVADLVTRRVAVDLGAVSRLSAAGVEAQAPRTKGGTASVVSWLPFPSEHADSGAWLCVEFRSARRANPGTPWLLRLGVEVGAGDRTDRQARAAAHDLAVPLRHELKCAALRQHLQHVGQDGLASFVRPGPRTIDGLKGDPDADALAAWRTNALTNDAYGEHPALFHDWGRRLASQILVDVTDLDRHQIVELLAAALDHLENAAKRQTSAAT
ncbi:MAG TPA: hypothetical protein VM942_10390 [Acidimicrobiales bacterium]|nr:hypothetical protein [Acidimicrobiales bacterium]